MAITPPIIVENSETQVVAGAFAFVVDVNLALDCYLTGDDGVFIQTSGDTSEETNSWMTFSAWVDGFIVQTGGVLTADTDGGFPLSASGSLLTENAVVTIQDVFILDQPPGDQ